MKKIPEFNSDKEAEDFVDNADLTEYDLSEFKKVNFELEQKTARVNMRISESLLGSVNKI